MHQRNEQSQVWHRWLFIAAAIAALFIVQSAAFARGAKETYAEVTAGELQRMLGDKDFTLVNVHVPYEGEIAGTDLFIQFDRIDLFLEGLPDKDVPILLYCRSGTMSTKAANSLVEEGYTKVMELDGGFNAWRAAGNELLLNPSSGDG